MIHLGRIKDVKGREVLDSRGTPTVEAELKASNIISRAMVPSGKSTGVHEAVELRDNDKKRYFGRGVLTAVENINNPLKSALVGRSVLKQSSIDRAMAELDGTVNKSRLGANAILAVSLACARAGAMVKDVPLYSHIRSLYESVPPVQDTLNDGFLKKANPDVPKGSFVLPIPSFNVLNGGVHAGNNLDFQEFMIMPVHAPSFSEGLRQSVEVYHELRKRIINKYDKTAVNVGDEGGFAPPIDTPEEALSLLTDAIEELGYSGIFKIAIDAAASEFYHSGSYIVNGRKMNSDQLTSLYDELVSRFPIISIEDPFAQDDFASFSSIVEELGAIVQIVGDDLLVTNPQRIKEAIEKKAVTALLLKVNQIGTLTESLEAASLASSNGLGVMISHRSGETEDPFIAHLAVGVSAGQIKSGAPCRSERLAKYNELLRIEESLGKKAFYAGKSFRSFIKIRNS